jgi:hypothetical protein
VSAPPIRTPLVGLGDLTSCLHPTRQSFAPAPVLEVRPLVGSFPPSLISSTRGKTLQPSLSLSHNPNNTLRCAKISLPAPESAPALTPALRNVLSDASLIGTHPHCSSSLKWRSRLSASNGTTMGRRRHGCIAISPSNSGCGTAVSKAAALLRALNSHRTYRVRAGEHTAQGHLYLPDFWELKRLLVISAGKEMAQLVEVGVRLPAVHTHHMIHVTPGPQLGEAKTQNT